MCVYFWFKEVVWPLCFSTGLQWKPERSQSTILKNIDNTWKKLNLSEGVSHFISCYDDFLVLGVYILPKINDFWPMIQINLEVSGLNPGWTVELLGWTQSVPTPLPASTYCSYELYNPALPRLFHPNQPLIGSVQRETRRLLWCLPWDDTAMMQHST